MIDMLRTLRDSPYRALQTTNVNIEKMNIFEVFIRMFVDEVFFIVKRGLKCGYETVEENATFFRGKLKFSQQIRINHTHKERSYILSCTHYVSCSSNYDKRWYRGKNNSRH